MRVLTASVFYTGVQCTRTVNRIYPNQYDGPYTDILTKV